MTYLQKLQSPQWQKKRLEILERDQWTCCKCKDTESQLHVHHKSYVFGNDPWEYPDSNFMTLCDECHQDEEYAKFLFKNIVRIMLEKGCVHDDLLKLLYAKYFELTASEQKGQNNG